MQCSIKMKFAPLEIPLKSAQMDFKMTSFGEGTKLPIHLQWASDLMTTAAMNMFYGQPTWLLCSIMYRAVHIFTN